MEGTARAAGRGVTDAATYSVKRRRRRRVLRNCESNNGTKTKSKLDQE